jgi:hypothetical protein
MSKFVPGAVLACAALSCVLLTSCGSSNPTHVVANGLPSTVSLTPSPNISLELGKFQVLTATAKNGVGTTITETFSYRSSNPSVATVANNGTLCAGTWDSLTTPTICTPGATGTAQVVASAQGVTSPPVTVYVHQHVTNIVISKVPNQPPTLSTLCLSKRAPSGNPESTLYQAFAFNGNTDITASVGPFTWQAVSVAGQTNAVSLTSLPSGSTQCQNGQQGACLNQQIATANDPGITSFFASAGGVNSSPLQFTTCPVQSISINALETSQTSFLVSTGTSTTLNATVTDSLGMTLTGVPLTWNSSNPIVVKTTGATSTVFGSVGTATASAEGAAAVTASCTPPSCNAGFAPSMPIYPTQAISFTVKSASNTSPAAPTVYVTSTDCGSTTEFCTTRAVPISRAASTSTFTPQAPITLPFVPNSFLFGPEGSTAYLGTNTLSFGTQTAMAFTGSAVSQIPNVAGKILATSPDGATAIFSDTNDSPNRVFICQNCSSTTSQSVSTFLMNGAVAAAFSIDSIAGGYKAYVVSGQPCPGAAGSGCLLVFSKLDAAKLVPLPAPATDVTFIGNGTLGYIAGGDPAGSAFLPTCADPSTGSIGSVALPSQFIRALPDGQSALALNVPNIQSVTAAISGTGCTPPRGSLSITNNPGPSASLGVSNFTPTQFLLSPDGSTAYVLGETGSGVNVARLPFILAFNTTTQNTADISLSGNATPLSAAVSPAGDFLFVGADDGTVHVIDTLTQVDIQQVAFPFPQNSICIGPGNPATQPPVTCNPDLVAVRP